jgi:hypothetical protein
MDMFRLLAVSLLCAVAVHAATDSSEAVRNGGETPGHFVRSTGGPDEYGYTWIDSDEGGGPTYNWVDITGIGTQVEGLSDDNVIGPFSIGFDFPYYWYAVNRFYVCSNGVISFSSGQMWTSHNNGSIIPRPQLPNDVLAPLGGDLNFGEGRGECYYYTNFVDSLVVSYIDVPEWHYGTDTLGSHTFQIILNKADSTITFQYGPQDGTFDYGNPGTPVSVGIGIENVTGDIGLQYLLDNSPPDNMYEDSLAILFVPPESTTYEVTDISMLEAGSEGNLGFFLVPYNDYEPWARVKNTGNQEIAEYSAYFQIREFLGGTLYSDTMTGGPLQPSEEDTISFEGWTPIDIGWYDLRSWVTAADDPVHFNDSSRIDMRVVGHEATLWYMNDTLAVNPSYWYGAESGWGARFTPPSYPTTVETVQVMLVGNGSTPEEAWIYLYDDDGPNGLPGSILAGDTFDVVSADPLWYDLVPDPFVEITEGSFYVGMIQATEQGPSFALCVIPPFSRQLLENTGAWATYRNAELNDPGIRVKAYVEYGVEENTSREVHRPRVQLIQNPVGSLLSLGFDLAVKDRVNLSIFDAAGRRLEFRALGELQAGTHEFTVPVSDLPGGVYFLRIKGEREDLGTERFILVE